VATVVNLKIHISLQYQYVSKTVVVISLLLTYYRWGVSPGCILGIFLNVYVIFRPWLVQQAFFWQELRGYEPHRMN
jgi:hypothetical protein